ncbi:MAG: hypothetical protein AB1921_16710 [Thermodesulfobacteriota bacterium]
MFAKRMTIILAALTLMLLAAVPAFAQHGGGRWWNRPAVADKLALTDAEKAQLDELYAQNERERIDLKAAVARQRFELSQVMENPSSGEKEIMERFSALQKAQNDLANGRFRFLLDVRKTIGADRFRTLTEMFDEFRKNRKGRWMEGRRGHMHDMRADSGDRGDEARN